MPRYLMILALASFFVAPTACDRSRPPADDYADKMASEHRGDRPIASPETARADGGAARAERVIYATVDAQAIAGYHAKPQAPDARAGLIVIHEWWGLNDNIRTMARALAQEGYHALAVDLYRGAVAETPDKAMALLKASQGREAAIGDNLRQAIAYLHKQGVKHVGVIGWCFGGGWSLQTALIAPDDIDATVIYYGRVPTDASALSALKSPVLGLFGGRDQGIPLKRVRAFEAALKRAGKQATIVVYPEADHAFANPSGTLYNKQAADDAWAKTTAFLHAELRAKP